MTIDEIVLYVEALGGVLAQKPQPGDGSPEISWGDVFFYYAPDGVVPRAQPFATIVTKDYPDDAGSRLDREGAFRVNVSAGAEAFAAWTAEVPGPDGVAHEAGSVDDVVIAHPVYGSLGWLAVVKPGPATDAAVRELLREAHRRARARHERRSAVGDDAS